MSSVDVLTTGLERRRAELGAAATGFHGSNLKRQLTWLDADNDPGFTHFYLDMSFERRDEDQALNWFSINYCERSIVDPDVDVDAVARALHEHTGLQRILARVPRTVRTWIDGDLPDEPDES